MSIRFNNKYWMASDLIIHLKLLDTLLNGDVDNYVYM